MMYFIALKSNILVEFLAFYIEYYVYIIVYSLPAFLSGTTVLSCFPYLKDFSLLHLSSFLLTHNVSSAQSPFLSLIFFYFRVKYDKVLYCIFLCCYFSLCALKLILIIRFSTCTEYSNFSSTLHYKLPLSYRVSSAKSLTTVFLVS